MLQFDNVQEMWKYFTTTGLPGQGKPGASPVSAIMKIFYPFLI